MQDLLNAVAQFSPAQLLTSLAILTPFVVGIWFAMKWAYDTRLQNLETALTDFRADFERRLARELAKLTDTHEAAIAKLKQELESIRDRATTAESKVSQLEREANENEEKLLLRAQELDDSYDTLSKVFQHLLDREFEVVIFCLGFRASLSLFDHLRFSDSQIDQLAQMVKKNDAEAMYVYGRLLVAHRVRPPSSENGMVLIRRAAKWGVPAADSFLRKNAG